MHTSAYYFSTFSNVFGSKICGAYRCILVHTGAYQYVAFHCITYTTVPWSLVIYVLHSLPDTAVLQYSSNMKSFGDTVVIFVTCIEEFVYFNAR